MIIKGNSVGHPLSDPRKGLNMTGSINMNLKRLFGVKTPVEADDATNKAYVDAHINNKSNPHGVTAEQVGARPNTWTPSASDVGAAPASHATDKNNPHGVTAAQVGATPASHAIDKNNPHGVTAAQVGARPDTWMPSAWEVGAAVGKGYLPRGTDFNAVTASGMYRFEDNNINSPPSASYGQLLVIQGSGDTITQIAGDYDGGKLWTRSGDTVGNGGFVNWTPWASIFDTAHPPISAVLWENGSPGSEFPGQKVWVGLSKYRFVLLGYFLEGTSYLQYKYLHVDNYTRIHGSHVHDADGQIVLQDMQRDVHIEMDGVSFSDGKYLSTRGDELLTSNNSIKPHIIYGVY